MTNIVIFKFQNNSQHLVSLGTLLLEHKSKFKLEEVTIKKLLTLLWTAFIETILNKVEENPQNQAKTVIALIYELNSQGELEALLNDLENSKDPFVVCHILKNIAEHAISRNKTEAYLAKSEAFSSQYKRIMNKISVNSSTALNADILKAHIEVAKNVRIPMSEEIAGDFVESLIRVDIKSFEVTDGSVNSFIELHQLMAELLFLLVSVRADVTLNCLQPLLMVFENLLASISLFKSDRKSEEQLANSEVAMVADLAHKLEKYIFSCYS